MNTAIVMLGSNIDQNRNLNRAKERLADFFEILDESTVLITEPIGRKYTTKFHNQAIKVISDDSAKEVAGEALEKGKEFADQAGDKLSEVATATTEKTSQIVNKIKGDDSAPPQA